jgi:hypothetical protein
MVRAVRTAIRCVPSIELNPAALVETELPRHGRHVKIDQCAELGWDDFAKMTPGKRMRIPPSPPDISDFEKPL